MVSQITPQQSVKQIKMEEFLYLPIQKTHKKNLRPICKQKSCEHHLHTFVVWTNLGFNQQPNAFKQSALAATQSFLLESMFAVSSIKTLNLIALYQCSKLVVRPRNKPVAVALSDHTQTTRVWSNSHTQINMMHRYTRKKTLELIEKHLLSSSNHKTTTIVKIISAQSIVSKD